MRFLVKATVPTEAGNRAIKDGSLSNTIRKVMDDLKPEAAYFFEENGHRTCLFVLHVDKASDIPRISEPFFLGVNAEVRIRPVMTAEDLGAAGLDQLAQKWG